MARDILTPKAVDNAKPRKGGKRGMYGDGGGLWLQVTPGKTNKKILHKSWIFRFTSDGGTRREMGLGSLSDVGLSEAREKADEARKLYKNGTDPIAQRHAERTVRRLAAVKSMTFDQCAATYIEAMRPSWRNVKHAAQWELTLKTYASPVFGKLPVQNVDLTLISRVLEPIWNKKTETASRLRGRIEAVLGWATVRGYRVGDNPARWHGHLDKLLPARSKVQKIEHHAALPYDEIGAFMAELRERKGTTARALEFLILTAARTSEVLGATWDEIDLDARVRVWTVPAERMKADKEHRVPLSPRTVEIINDMRRIRRTKFVFPGNGDKPMSTMTMAMLIRRMGRGDLTVHGFRSSFRDWAAERTNFANHVVEMALAHAVGDKVEAAYRRGDLFEKRRRLMSTWADFCALAAAPAGDNVRNLAEARA